jgi:hypothetical protein
MVLKTQLLVGHCCPRVVKLTVLYETRGAVPDLVLKFFGKVLVPGTDIITYTVLYITVILLSSH